MADPSAPLDRADSRSRGEYSATEAAAAANEGYDATPELKNQKIRALESTVSGLNTRIQELESKLQASQNRPRIGVTEKAAVTLLEKSRSSSPDRQDAAGPAPTVAANDPGAGYVNDANVRSFQQGKILFDQEKFPEAILAFSAFLERNETHALAGNAQYFIAESYFQQSDFVVADQEFQKLVIRYPSSPRMSWALVRLAECNERTGRTEEARRYRMQAEANFSRSPALRSAGPAPAKSESAASAPIKPSAAATAALGGATPIATAPDATENGDIPIPALPMPTLSIEKPIAPSAARDLDGPPGPESGI